jgi:conjugal transfer ATP-binding protein TraC
MEKIVFLDNKNMLKDGASTPPTPPEEQEPISSSPSEPEISESKGDVVAPASPVVAVFPTPVPTPAPVTSSRAPLSLFGKGEASKEAESLYRQGIATLRDLIAPPAIKVASNSMQIGSVIARTYFVVAYPRYLSTNWFSPIINIDFSMDTALFIHPIDTAEIMKNLRKSATQVQSQIHIEAEDGKIRDPMLETALQDIEGLRDKLQQGTEKFFRFGLYMTVFGKDETDLSDKCHSIQSILEAQLVYTKPAILRMDQGFAATRPLGNDVLDVANNLNTEPLSTTFPFVSSDLSSNQGIFYGINRHNNGLILFDRFKMENANMVVFAKSGAGKSYTVKLEVLRSMMFGANVIIIDPENEYKHLCEAVGGTFLKISLNSDVHLNPFDLPQAVEDEDPEGVFRNSIANLIGLLHLMLGSVTPEEDSILDRAIRETYAIRDISENSDFSKFDASSFPTMSDLYAVLQNMEGAESLSVRLERYTEGIFGGFLDKQTNVETDNQLVTFNIRDLEEELRPIAMYIILQFIWNEIRSKMKKRVVVVDEAWVMMQHEDAAGFLFGIAKRCRKYYTGLTTITQDISDFMSSRYGKPIITNSSLQLLLRQSPSSIDLVAETFFLTDHEKFLLLESNVGEGIFFAGMKHAAIKIIASYSEDQIITSDPRQLLEIEEAKKDFDSGN